MPGFGRDIKTCYRGTFDSPYLSNHLTKIITAVIILGDAFKKLQLKNSKSLFFSIGLMVCFSCTKSVGLTINNSIAVHPDEGVAQTIDFTPDWDETRALKNPHKGWYHHLVSNNLNTYPVSNMTVFDNFPGMDHVYVRIGWSYLEDGEGNYKWSVIDNLINQYTAKGYGVSFRIVSKDTGETNVKDPATGIIYVTPKYVRDAGAQGAVYNNIWMPEWSDPVYLSKLKKFLTAFADRYESQPWFRYIDIGSIGEWGEGHTFFSSQVPPTVSDVKANIDVYKTCFKKALIVAPDDLLWYGKSAADVQSLYNYAVANGLTIRDDTPFVDWYLQQNLSTYSVTNPEFYTPLYETKPVIMETEHYTSIKSNGNWVGKNGQDPISKLNGFSGADIFKGVLNIMHPTYIGYHGFVEDWYADNPDLAKELLNKCGYWYFPVSATFNAQFPINSQMSVSIKWVNKGVAPAYNVYGILFEFTKSDNSNQKYYVYLPDSKNKELMPATAATKVYQFTVPDLPPGSYNLRFKLEYRNADNTIKQQIALGMKETKQEGGYTYLGTLSLQ